MKELFLLLFFYLILSSGSLLGATIGKRFEECLPVTASCITLFIYAFSLFGFLGAGVRVALILSIGAILFSAYRMVKSKKISEYIKYIFTPGWLVFTVFFFVLAYLDHGKVATNWDEFSHWMLCVKDMFVYGDLTTNPLSIDAFKSYPPAMAVFQYFYIRLRDLIGFDAHFFEWKAYHAYQVLAVSFMTFFLGKTKWKDAHVWMIFAVGAALIPSVFYEWYFGSIYIDAFIGICAGCGFAGIMLSDKEDRRIQVVYEICICAMLTLSKDVGFMFAVFVSVSFALSVLISRRRKNQMIAFMPMIIAVICKISWKYKLSADNVQIAFGNRIDFFHYLRMLILHDDKTYRQEVVDNSIKEFFLGKAGFHGFFDQMTNAVFALALLILSICMILVLSRHVEKGYRGSYRIALISPVITIFLYAMFIGGVYAYRFSKAEAVGLASYNRYLGMALLSGILAFFLSLIYCICKMNAVRMAAWIIALALMVFILLSVPYDNLYLFVRGYYKTESVMNRWKYVELSNLIQATVSSEDRIGYIDQSNGIEAAVLSFELRPQRVCLIDTISESGDNLSPDELLERIVSSYDYLVILDADKELYDGYAIMFGEVPCDKSIYKIDKDNNRLIFEDSCL